MTRRFHPAYLNYEDMMAQIESWQGEFPDLVSVEAAGRTPEGREIPALCLTRRDTGKAETKPALYVDAGQHAGELAGYLVVSSLVERLLQGCGVDDQITGLMERYAFYLMPRVSPDGTERHLTGSDYIRSSPREHPGRPRRGIRPRDIDGNGLILVMRRADPAGDWIASSLDDRIMMPRPPGERSADETYYRLYPEGLVEGEMILDPPALSPVFGMDFNRNYPGTWRTEKTQAGSGPFPLSEPETRTVADFISAHPNIGLAVSLHTWGGFILRPPCTVPDSSIPEDDLEALIALGRAGEEATGYKVFSLRDQFAPPPEDPPYGSFLDFCYEMKGILCFAPELWSLPTKAGIPLRPPIELRHREAQEVEKEGMKMLEWIDSNLEGEGVYPWEPFQHPQLGQVEIGGWDVKTVIQNPPPDLFRSEQEGMVDYLLVLAGSLPRLWARETEMSRVAPGVFRVIVEVANSGYLPTSGSDRARTRNLTQEVAATLVVPPGGRILEGDRVQKLGHLPGGKTLRNSPVGFSFSPSASARARWLVQLDETLEDRIEVEVGSPRSGTLNLSLGTEYES